MTTASTTRGAEIRSQLGHPIIDSDGHTVEVKEVMKDFVRDVGGPKAVDQYEARYTPPARQAGLDERREAWRASPAHWFWTANALDRATAMLPKLYHERMDELGLDFSLVYPSTGLGYQMDPDDDLRRILCRAENNYLAEMHRGFEDRILPVAVIPMHTPEEAIDELEYAVGTLGMRAVVLPSFVRRPIPKYAGQFPETAQFAYRLDTYGIDSEHDYDPVWAKCVELRVVPGVHTNTLGYGFRSSVSSYSYNHIGHFAAAGHAVAKAIFLGGVTRRFPELQFAFLEGGVGWGCQLFGDLIEHWERRGAKALERMKPEKLDRELLMQKVEKYGYSDIAAALKARNGWPSPDTQHLTGNRDEVDDFAACKIAKKQDWIDLYAKPFYFGCEADDRMNATAFGRGNPFGARLNAIFSSDIGHFDVIDFRDPVPEAYELVEKELITAADFRDFTFANTVRLWGAQNPRFFDGTVVAKEAAAVLNGNGQLKAAADD